MEEVFFLIQKLKQLPDFSDNKESELKMDQPNNWAR